ncbi:MAG: CoA-binding protein, partial [bacterium]
MLEKLFDPKSIAVIGASRQEGKVGYSILKNLLQYGYQGKIYPINPKAEEILRTRTYPTIFAVEGEIDLAIIAIPSQIVSSILKDCVNRRIGAVIIISAGFKESSKQGSQLERELVEIIKNSR